MNRPTGLGLLASTARASRVPTPRPWWSGRTNTLTQDVSGVSCAVEELANPVRASRSKAPTRWRSQPSSARHAAIRAISPRGTHPGRACLVASHSTGIRIRQRRKVTEAQSSDVHRENLPTSDARNALLRVAFIVPLNGPRRWRPRGPRPCCRPRRPFGDTASLRRTPAAGRRPDRRRGCGALEGSAVMRTGPASGPPAGLGRTEGQVFPR
jgi:hypothetical protein